MNAIKASAPATNAGDDSVSSTRAYSKRASCAELVRETRLAQSTVSEHLRLIREAGLVSVDGDARRGDYRVDVHRVRRLKALVGSL